MIKLETIGQIEIAKINPVLKSENAVTNYDFITDNDILYLIANTLTGDDNGREDVTIAAGEFLNGYQVDVFAGQKLVIDAKHITGTEYSDLAVGNVLTVNNAGKLVVGSAPESGVYFVVTEKTTLTGPAVKARVCVA